MVTKVAEEKLKTTKHPFDFTLCITVILLLSLGLVMVMSASAPTSLSVTGNSYNYVIRQGVFAVLGLIIMGVLSKIDYHLYQKLYKIAYIVAVVALLSVAIPGIGVDVKVKSYLA